MVQRCLGLLVSFMAAPFLNADTLYVSNWGNGAISAISENGTVSTFTNTARMPYGLAFDSRGRLHVAIGQMTNRISRISTNGTVSTFVTLPLYFDATGLALDSRGRLYVASQGARGIFRVSATGTLSPFAPGFYLPFGLAFDRADNLYVAEQVGSTVKKITPAGTVTVFAAGISGPWGLAFDANGNLYVASFSSGTITKVTPEGVKTPFASGLGSASGIAFDTAGNLFVADQGGNSISKIFPDGTVVRNFTVGLSTPLFIAVRPDLTPPTLNLSSASSGQTDSKPGMFILRGGINLYFEAQRSDDLLTWTPFQTNQVVGGSEVRFVDPEAGTNPNRFYRARRLP